MLSQELNERLTQVGAQRPAGKLLRQYWQPVALTDELPAERPVTPVALMGERLVLFRDEAGELGLIDRHCPHRGADLCFGRLEENGMRCPFHGWHFDRQGQCVEQPAEPEGSRMHEKIKTTAYPVIEKSGIVFAYLGSGEPPALPNFDCFRAPDSHVFAFKGLWECNWLQALEVGIDPAHASFLHRFLQDEDPEESYGKQFRDKSENTEMPMTQVLREYPRPDIQVTETDYGLKLTALRNLDNGATHVRITNQIFPTAICIPMSREMTITQWHVPVDDVSCYWFAIFTSFNKPVDKRLMREQRLKEHRLPDYAPLKNRGNSYRYNIEEQKNLTYTGMGMDINVHDQWACEGMGAIQDRTKEHLGKSDIGIIRYRRMLRRALDNLESGNRDALPMQAKTRTAMLQGPTSNDLLAATASWQADADRAELERRAACPWDATLAEPLLNKAAI